MAARTFCGSPAPQSRNDSSLSQRALAFTCSSRSSRSTRFLRRRPTATRLRPFPGPSRTLELDDQKLKPGGGSPGHLRPEGGPRGGRGRGRGRGKGEEEAGWGV